MSGALVGGSVNVYKRARFLRVDENRKYRRGKGNSSSPDHTGDRRSSHEAEADRWADRIAAHANVDASCRIRSNAGSLGFRMQVMSLSRRIRELASIPASGKHEAVVLPDSLAWRLAWTATAAAAGMSAAPELVDALSMACAGFMRNGAGAAECSASALMPSSPSTTVRQLPLDELPGMCTVPSISAAVLVDGQGDASAVPAAAAGLGTFPAGLAARGRQHAPNFGIEMSLSAGHATSILPGYVLEPDRIAKSSEMAATSAADRAVAVPTSSVEWTNPLQASVVESLGGVAGASAAEDSVQSDNSSSLVAIRAILDAVSGARGCIGTTDPIVE